MTSFAKPLGWTVLANAHKDQHTRSTKGMQNNQHLTPHCLPTELKIVLVLGTKHVIHSLDTKLNQLNAAASRLTWLVEITLFIVDAIAIELLSVITLITEVRTCKSRREYRRPIRIPLPN